MNINDFFTYSAGDIFWKKRPLDHFKNEKEYKRWNTRHSFNKAGCSYSPNKSSENYLRVVVNSKWLLVHRVVWEMHFGKIDNGMQIDHINGDGTDNRLENLRVVSEKINKMNRPKYKNNKSGISGVSWDKKSKKWRARLSINGSRPTVYLGNCLLDAKKIMEEHQLSSGYHENHGR